MKLSKKSFEIGHRSLFVYGAKLLNTPTTTHPTTLTIGTFTTGVVHPSLQTGNENYEGNRILNS